MQILLIFLHYEVNRRYHLVTDQNLATVKPLTDSLEEVSHTPYKVNLKGIPFCNDLFA